jgi:hypothetical protein
MVIHVDCKFSHYTQITCKLLFARVNLLNTLRFWYIFIEVIIGLIYIISVRIISSRWKSLMYFPNWYIWIFERLAKLCSVSLQTLVTYIIKIILKNSFIRTRWYDEILQLLDWTFLVFLIQNVKKLYYICIKPRSNYLCFCTNANIL